MLNSIMTKLCSRCKVEKPFTEFHKRSDRPCGLQSWCKLCIAERNADPVKKQIAVKHRMKPARQVQIAEYESSEGRKQQRINRVESGAYRKSHNKWYAGKGYRTMRNHHLIKTYGISIDRFEEILLEQSGKCAICPRTEAGGVGAWHVEHCHITKKVRGLTCHWCNVMLGMSGDNAERLREGADYLDRTNSAQIVVSSPIGATEP